MFDEIKGSLPPIGLLAPDEREFFDALPLDYKAFLRDHNGGLVEEFRYSFRTGVPFKTAEVDNKSRDDSPIEFFGIPTVAGFKSPPDDLIQIAVDHAAETFLPRDVFAIARCVQNSLVCLSIRPDSFGKVYYWDWYWRYPWCRDFFQARIDKARLEVAQDAVADENHPKHQSAIDTLNFATLVELADSFTEWCHNCTDGRTHMTVDTDS